MQPTLEEVVRRARAVAEEVLAPQAESVDRDARWPEEGMRALQATGLGGLVVPRSAGGLGMGLSGLAQVCEALGGACASTAISFGMHNVAAAVIAAKATAEQVRDYLEPIARGQHLSTLALSEPGSGVHFYLPETRLSRVEDGLHIRGQKSFVTNGSHADSYVVSAVALDEETSIGEFSCVLVPRQADNLRWGPAWDGLGMRGNDARTLELADVAVPRRNLLGREGDQIWYFFHVVAPYFLVAMAGTYLGVATAALELARLHLGERRYSHRGSGLAQEPVLQHRLGVIWAQVARTRALVHYAAEAGDRGADDALPALCSAKAEVAECAVDVVNEVMTLLGGKGYGADSLVHRLLRDARAAHVMSPTTDLLRTWTGRALLDVPLLAD